MTSSSDNSNAKYFKNYNEITNKKQDMKYIYLMFDGVFSVIDKETCGENLEEILQLLDLRKTDNKIQNKIKRILLVFFILSLVSIYIALIVCAVSIANSPLPDFPLTMAEHMWKFFFIVPIPVTSLVLGIIYIKKGYKCKKNIIAGIIMTSILCIFGSFSYVFSNQVSHDMDYLNQLSEKIGIDFPSDGYISIQYNYQENCESLAMVKFYEDADSSFESNLNLDNNWKENTAFIPSNVIDLYYLTITSEYDYYTIYNLSTNSYNTFDGKLIYLAYDVETNVLFIYCYI